MRFISTSQNKTPPFSEDLIPRKTRFSKEAFERARDCGEEYVNIEFTSAQTGILIKPVGDSGFLYFILPVRLH